MDKLSLTFAALADPTRRAILQRLSRGEAIVSELAKPFHTNVLGGLPGCHKSAGRSGRQDGGSATEVCSNA